jgi:hypothetical protein
VRRKAAKTLSALSSLGSSTWGLILGDARKIYRGVGVLQIMYACSAWSNANWRTRGKPYTDKTLAQLQSIQARAARASRVEREIENEPTQSHTKSRIQDEGGFDLERLEAITPHIVPPWWTGPSMYIEESAEKAEARHHCSTRSEPDAVHIYTDGSGIKGHVGAAAVSTTTHQTKSAYIGDDTVSTVYAGKLQGIILALQIAQEDRDRGNRRKKVLIYMGNQAAIRAAAKPRGASGAYLLQVIA